MISGIRRVSLQFAVKFELISAVLIRFPLLLHLRTQVKTSGKRDFYLFEETVCSNCSLLRFK